MPQTRVSRGSSLMPAKRYAPAIRHRKSIDISFGYYAQAILLQTDVAVVVPHPRNDRPFLRVPDAPLRPRQRRKPIRETCSASRSGTESRSSSHLARRVAGRSNGPGNSGGCCALSQPRKRRGSVAPCKPRDRLRASHTSKQQIPTVSLLFSAGLKFVL